MKRSALLALLSGMLMVACGGGADPGPAPADATLGTTEAGVCSDGSCTCLAPDCDALNNTSCGKVDGPTTACSWYDGSACRTATCTCRSWRWICP